jgi:hypothetical protein
MSNRSAGAGIRCPIDLFDAHEGRIKTLTAAINAAPTASEKTPFARDLLDEAGVLLACASYEAANPNCGLCRGFSTLRLQIANLVVKAGTRAAP